MATIKVCHHCSIEFKAKHSVQIYCSNRCSALGTGRRPDVRARWGPEKPSTIKICPECKSEFRSTYSHRMYVCCSRRCANKGIIKRYNLHLASVGKHNAMWRGGRTKNSSGYIMVRTDGKYIPEHRLVMEKMIGRKLTINETVHHKNGIRYDNRPENLELWKGKHGKGIRQSDYHCAGCTCDDPAVESLIELATG